MARPDPELVRTIADAVLAALADRAAGGCGCGCANGGNTGVGNGGSEPAEVRPPAGICTGDYSKFRELQNTSEPGEPTRPEPGSPPAGARTPRLTAVAPPRPAPPERILTGFVTADALQAAWDASPHGTASLAPDARLTPLAQDLARDHAQRIRRSSATPTAAGGIAVPPADLPWLWWQDGDARVDEACLGGRGNRLRRVSGNALADVIRHLAQEVRLGRAAGGVLLVRSAARATCYANRCRSLRAVVATSGEAVEIGLRELGCNTLLIETPHHGPAAIAAMLDRILLDTPRPQQHVLRELEQLHHCT